MTGSKKWLIACLGLTAVTLSLLAVKSVLSAGANAYLYGYPIVLMDQTRSAMLANGAAAQNQFVHKTKFPDHEFRNVVRPNVDTLYSIAWLELSDGPLLLSVPNTNGRYYIMPLMDMWTNVFASVGKRTHGTEAGKFLIVGPNAEQAHLDLAYKNNMPVIQSPTSQVWIIGRIQVDGLGDIDEVVALQKQFSLETLLQKKVDDFILNTEKDNRAKALRANLTAGSAHKVSQLSAMEFVNRLMALIKFQGPLKGDQQALVGLKSLGFDPSSEQASYELNVIRQWLLEKSFSLTKSKIKTKLGKRKGQENGWLVRRNDIGVYGNNYTARAAVAMIGLGALPPEDAVYPNTHVDSQGQPLNGANRYILRFDAQQLPPVDAFWSLTMYDEEGFLVDSDIKRYAIGDRDQLNFNADGSLDIIIQHERPAVGQSNWLPAPLGKFAVTLRMYLPQDAFLEGRWTLPGIQKKDT